MADGPTIILLPPAQGGQGVVANPAIIHDNETFKIQWVAFNASQVDSEAFVDELEILAVPEGCPASDNQDHPLVHSEDASEPPLPAGTKGSLMDPTVGPFAAGAYLLKVTVDKGRTGTIETNCITIVAAV